ncbi:MAG: glycosyltransferase family 4 protein [Bacteroidales bacterium]|nr:glycosyltransferase family 4 protein [Bacteroidales bacterium]MDD3666278.1 glycosyltransferase family 4 protein [Bacteroidales bacterium]
MNIGVVVDNIFYNDERVKNEVKAISKEGHNIFVLCLRFSKYEKTQNNLNISNLQVVSKWIPRKIKDFLFGIQLSIPVYQKIWSFWIEDFIHKKNIDVLHVHDLYLSLPAKQAIGNNNTTLITDLHENYPAAIMDYKWANSFLKRIIVKPWKWKQLEKKYLNATDYIITLSDGFKQNLLSKYENLNPDNFVVYPNVPDVEYLESLPINSNTKPNSRNDNTLLYFGGVSKRRGIITVLKAIKILKNEGIEITFHIVGPIDNAEKKEVLRSIQDRTIEKNIIYNSWKDFSDIPQLISNSTMCISPIIKNEQHDSGIANKVFQYMLFKKPVIVSDCIPQRELIETNHCGVIFHSNDEFDLAKAIKILINDPEQAKLMGYNGYLTIKNEYNLAIQGEKLKELYRKIELKRAKNQKTKND